MSEIGNPTHSMSTTTPISNEERGNEILCGKAEIGNTTRFIKQYTAMPNSNPLPIVCRSRNVSLRLVA